MASEKFMAQLIASSSVSQVGEHITRDMCFLGREHISLGICVSRVEEHISLGICVSSVGNTCHEGYAFHRKGTHITRDMFARWGNRYH